MVLGGSRRRAPSSTWGLSVSQSKSLRAAFRGEAEEGRTLLPGARKESWVGVGHESRRAGSKKPPFWVYLRSNFCRGQETLEEVRGTGGEGPNSGEVCSRRVGGKCTLKRLHPGRLTL